MADDRTNAPTRPGGPTKSEEKQRPDPYVGQVLAERYRVLRKLGEGGMGVVYLAEHVRIEKKFAVKVLSGDYARRGDLLARFEQEAKAASRIGHENIVDITDFGETGTGSPFFVMELLEGRDLGHYLRSYGAMSAHRTVRIVGQVCRALGAAHAKGIVHRDLKPENIFLIERGGRPDFVKVLDFGIAKVSTLPEGQRITRTGTIFGTAEYMSPEQARGDNADHRTDIYAAGCILYEMLTGDVPFRAHSFMSVLRKQLEEPVTPPSLRKPEANIAPALEAVVMKALQKDRDARFQSMSELAFALADASGEDPKAVWGGQEIAEPMTLRVPAVNLDTPTRVETPVPAPTKRETPVPLPERSRSGLLWLGGLVVLAAGAVALWLSTRPAPPTPTPTPVVAHAPPPPPAAPPPPTTHRVRIVTTPDHAEVRNGAERLGLTPLEQSLPLGALDVTVEKKGYKPQTLHVAADGEREYVLTLVPVEHRATKPAPATPAAPKKPSELKDVD